jgi:hypothetical protein
MQAGVSHIRLYQWPPPPPTHPQNTATHFERVFDNTVILFERNSILQEGPSVYRTLSMAS